MAASKRALDDEYLEKGTEIVETVRSGRCQVALKYDFTAACPFDDTTDEYTLTITYLPTDDRCLELQSVRKFLDELEGVESGQEAITHFLAHFFFYFLKPEWIAIELAGEHYGIHTTTSKRREQ